MGEKVYAIGAPEGLELTISGGLISGLRDFDKDRVIQTSAAISPGSSGGGLFDAEARLVGITTFYLKEGQTLNFALPADLILELGKYGNSVEGRLTGTYSGVVINFVSGSSANSMVIVSERGRILRGCMGRLHASLRKRPRERNS